MVKNTGWIAQNAWKMILYSKKVKLGILDFSTFWVVRGESVDFFKVKNDFFKWPSFCAKVSRIIQINKIGAKIRPFGVTPRPVGPSVTGIWHFSAPLKSELFIDIDAAAAISLSTRIHFWKWPRSVNFNHGNLKKKLFFS
jgi:hypothetical protein